MARETVLSSGRRSALSGRPSRVLLCCWLVAFLMNGGGGGGGRSNGRNVEPNTNQRWSGGADAADVTADLAQAPAENNLGGLARACSNFCHAGVDGLDLWMSFEEVCITSSSPDFLEQMATGRKGSAASSRPASSSRQSLSNRYSSAAAAMDSGIYSTTQRASWPLLHSISIVSVVSTLGMFAGFRMGSRTVSVPKAALLPLL